MTGRAAVQCMLSCAVQAEREGRAVEGRLAALGAELRGLEGGIEVSTTQALH